MGRCVRSPQNDRADTGESQMSLATILQQVGRDIVQATPQTLVGEVVAMEWSPEIDPLVFYRGRYRNLRDQAA